MSEPGPEQRVHLIQLLCPRRHCILGCAYEPDKTSKSEAVEGLEARRALLGLNPWCGICGSLELHYEDERTPYGTLEEALGPLRVTEQANRESRALLDAMGQTYDSQPRN